MLTIIVLNDYSATEPVCFDGFLDLDATMSDLVTDMAMMDAFLAGLQIVRGSL